MTTSIEEFIDRRRFLGLSASALAAAAGGCRRSSDRAYARGNTLIVALSADASNADRPLCPDYMGEPLVFLPLVTSSEKGDRQPCLATHWEHSADYSEWTYRLRPGVHWHDGRPVTVDDVKFTLELHSRPDSPYFGSLTESVTVHDPSTFTVRGVKWSSYGGQDAWVSILPKHLVRGLDYQKFYQWDFWLRPVGCGPYRYLRYVPQTLVELEASPDYFKDKPRIARVVLKFVGGAGLSELLSGNADAITWRNPAEFAKLASDPRFRAISKPSPGRSWVIWWQNEHPLFRDRNIRRALTLAINRRELLQVLNLPSQFPLADGVYTLRQFQRGELPEPPRYDPAEARRLLDQAGWPERSGDGMRERGGHEFRFTAITLAEPGWDTAAVYIQDQFHRIGVQMDLLPLERDAGVDRLRTGQFEAILWLFDHETPSTFSVALFGRPAGAGYRNPRLINLLEFVKTTADPGAVEHSYRQMSDILRSDQPVAFLFPDSHTYVFRRRVKGLDAPWRADWLLPTEELWLDDRSDQ